MDISFVVPARNAEATIGATVRSLSDQVGTGFSYEIIVVDNGFDGGLRSSLAETDAQVILSRSTTISGVRNDGARVATGEFLVFVDADVTLEQGWAAEVAPALLELRTSRFAFSGSHCSIPMEASWFERLWIKPQRETTLSHIGSGHLIIRRDTFLLVGGFNESMSTGEDYELSQRLISFGGRMILLPSAIAIHHGNPRTLGDFVRRESWHGIGDCGSVQAVLKSRVALVALIIGVLHGLALVGLLVGDRTILISTIATVIGVCVASSIRSYGLVAGHITALNSVLYYFYYLARLSSFPRAAFPRLHSGWRRPRMEGPASA